MRYAIQCDRLQGKENGQNIWSTLMALATPVGEDEFSQVCDGTDLLDEGETFLDFCCADDEGGFYRCDTPEGPVYFMQTSGFEFFFTSSGKPPTYFDPADLSLTYEINRNGELGRLLLDPNDGRINGQNGIESSAQAINEKLEVIEGNHTRYRLLVEGTPVAGIKLMGDVISDIYVHSEHRRKGYATELMNLVTNEVGPLQPSPQQTSDGRAFFKSRKHDQCMDDGESLGM